MRKVIGAIAIVTYFIVGIIDFAAFLGGISALLHGDWALMWRLVLVVMICSVAGVAIIGTTMGLLAWLERSES